MPKINEEEYKILKGLDDKWKFIARDSDGTLAAGTFCPHKDIRYWKSGIKVNVEWIRLNSVELFQFIQWEDEELYIIAELIEEYESEETEVKKDKKWANEEIKKERNLRNDLRYEREVDDLTTGVLLGLKKALNILDQLDEPEALSQEWIDEYAQGDYDEWVYTEDLQNLLVPKQELIEAYKQEEDDYSNPENGWIGRFIEDLKKLVEKEQKYYVLGKHDTPILFRDHRNRITETSNLSDIYPKADSEDFEFTEQEIKDYDPRYWPFAKPVEEVD